MVSNDFIYETDSSNILLYFNQKQPGIEILIKKMSIDIKKVYLFFVLIIL